jgi:hypothetical protein
MLKQLIKKNFTGDAKLAHLTGATCQCLNGTAGFILTVTGKS